MNISEWAMPRAGRTVDRETVSPGWAGWHYKRPMLSRWQGPLSVLLASAMGVGLAAWMFVWWSS